MKVLNVDNIRKGDQYTIEHEPISSINLMERAATNCVQWICENYTNNTPVSIFSGIGNNGGDGLAIARLLSQKSYNIQVYIIEYSKKYSSDFKQNLQRLKKTAVPIQILHEEDYSFNIPPNSLTIDAIFGSGLSRPISGFAAKIINTLNESMAEIISIDIASGLFADKLSLEKSPSIVKCKHTLSLAFPKLAFFLAENEAYVGQWHSIEIGIDHGYIQSVEATAYYLEEGDIKLLLKSRSKFSHKGNYGHALLVAGSSGKMGAAILSAKAALRSGLGLLTTHIPSSAVSILQTAVPESMLSIDSNAEYLSEIKDNSIYNAIGIGPGLGTTKSTQLAFKLLIQNTKNPMVIDADAINILSENKTWLAFLPKGSILTPHPKEFERLTGKSNNSLDRIEKQQNISVKYGVYIVLKGANTTISTPDGKLYINSTGNPGMATAGSGDSLTGILLALLAQSYGPESACILGVFIHGLAGDIAALKKGFEALIASDIIDNLPNAFIKISSL